MYKKAVLKHYIGGIISTNLQQESVMMRCLSLGQGQ